VQRYRQVAEEIHSRICLSVNYTVRNNQHRRGAANMATTQVTKVLELAPIDNIMPATYTRLLLCFPFESNTQSKQGLVDSIQAGVDNVVSQMPMLAGSLGSDKDAAQSNRARVLYPTDSPKVTLHVSEPSSFTRHYAELMAASMPLESFDNSFAPVSVFADPLIGPCPVFAIQATFIPNGVCICVCVHHYIMDGTGFGTFLSFLADSCRSAGTFLITDVEAIQDRSSCKMGLQAGETAKEHPEYKLVDLAAESQSGASPPAFPAMKTRLFQFSSKSLAELKSDVTRNIVTADDPSLPSWVSTNDCLTALLWSCVTRARLSRLGDSSEQSSRLGMAVNGRRHLSPPVPATYLGNVNYFGTASIPMESLAAPGLASLATTARSVRAAIESIDTRHIHSANTLILSQKDIKSLTYGFRNFLGPDFGVTSWEAMGAYNHDWGCGIGKAEWVRTIPSGQGFDGLAIVYPARFAGGADPTKRELEVMLGLKTEDMQRLEADDVWNRYCDGIIGE
jgi:trichothecene 3-O-acetyltransferase